MNKLWLKKTTGIQVIRSEVRYDVGGGQGRGSSREKGVREVTKGWDSGSSKRKGRGRNLRGKGWGMLNISQSIKGLSAEDKTKGAGAGNARYKGREIWISLSHPI